MPSSTNAVSVYCSYKLAFSAFCFHVVDSITVRTNVWERANGLSKQQARVTAERYDAISSVESQAHPWKVVQQPGRHRPNLCADGKLLPELYVLGAPKSSSTTLAMDLSAAGISKVHDRNTRKEFHFFDSTMKWEEPGNFSNQWRIWREMMPPCYAKRRVLADFTPDYLRMVSFPTGRNRFGAFPPWNSIYRLGQIPAGGTQIVDLPPVLRNFYGENMGRLTFVALLREPLARMQSAWYHSKSFNFTNGCSTCRSKSFAHSIDYHLQKAHEQPPNLADWLWTGMYGAQLQHWFENFAPRSFVIIPMRVLNSAHKDVVCRKLSKRLNFKMGCESNGTTVSHEWTHPHPALHEDTTEHQRQAVDKFFAPDKELLVKVLADAQPLGASLIGYNGTSGNQTEIKEWLERYW